MEKKLNLGSAGRKKEGYINVDWNEIVSPDVIHDLNQYPYPFLEGEFDLIEADHVIEHLDRPFQVMTELHRLLKPNGRLIIRVPHFSRALTHPEHAHGFDVTFPNYFNPRFKETGFFGVEYKLEKMSLHWMAFFHLVREMGYGRFIIGVQRMLNDGISFLANLWPEFCSRVWCYWVGGFEEIEFHFRAVK